MHGKPVQCRRCPRNGKRALKIANRHCRPPGPREGGTSSPSRARKTGSVAKNRRGAARRTAFRYLQPAGTLAARLKDPSRITAFPSPASSARQPGHARPWPQPLLHRNLDRSSSRPPARWARDITTLRDTVVITGEELRAEGPLRSRSCCRSAPASRSAPRRPRPDDQHLPAGRRRRADAGAGRRAARGLRDRGHHGAREIPAGDDRRIEVVKGALSSLYGSEAIGGVVQIFTRGKSVPHLFASAAYGNDNDRRAAAGLATADATTHASLSLGARKVDAPSATNPRAPFGVHDPIADPTRTPSPRLRVSQRLWQGETIALEAFGTRSRTYFDGGSPEDRSDQKVFGGPHHLRPSRSARAGRQPVRRPFARRAGLRGAFPRALRDPPGPGHLDPRPRHARGQPRRGRRVRAPARSSPGERSGRAHLRARPPRHEVGVRLLERDVARAARRGERAPRRGRAVRLAQYRRRERRRPATDGGTRAIVTVARASAPPPQRPLSHVPGYTPTRSAPGAQQQPRALAARRLGAVSEWRLTGFDNRLEDLIVFSPSAGTVLNSPARACAAWSCGSRRSGSHEVARRVYRAAPEGRGDGARLQTRASRIRLPGGEPCLGRVDRGPRRGGVGRALRIHRRVAGLPHALVRARRCAPALRHLQDLEAELHAVNLGDRRYETAMGYDAPRRGVMLNVRFEAF